MHNFRFVLKQNIGAPPTPVVKVGDSVKRGQVIAEAKPDALSVPLHSSVTGKVRSVDEFAIEIERTRKTEEFIPVDRDGTPAEIVKRAGIIGLGGAGFPTYVKLGTQLKPGGYVLCNASECEPVLAHNIHQMEDVEGLVDGMRITMDSTGADHGIIGIKLKHKALIKQYTTFLKENGIKDIRVLPLRNIYPVGEERALIRDTINILLPPGALPTEANCVVLNAETLYSIRDAVREGKPLIDKWVTVAGRFRDIPENEVVTTVLPIGIAIDDVVEQFGGIEEPIGEVLLGGPYTGKRAEEGAALLKVTGGITATALFDKAKGKLGLIQCACGALEPRMREIAESMDAEVVGHVICKNAHEAGPAYKCEDPGNCPGQAEKVLELRKLGAEGVLIGHCTDCSNTVMGSAPQLGIDVHHITDHVMKTMGKGYIRTYDPDQI